jgi:O-antigen/teichoic acid export membrane protein
MRFREAFGGRLTRGVAWSLTGSLGLQAATVLAAILTARILGQKAFGELSLVRSTVVMLAALAGSGLSLAATQHVADLRRRDPAGAGRMIGLLSKAALALGLLASLTCWILARPLAGWLSPEPGLEPALRASAFLLLAYALGGVLSGALTGLEAFGASARLLLLEGALAVLLIPAGAWVAGVTGAVVGHVAAVFTALPFKQRALHGRLHAVGVVVARRHAAREWLALSRVALPAMLLGVSAQPFEWLARVTLAHRPGGLAQLGVFAAAFSWGNAVLFLPSQVSGPALPIIAHTAAAGDRSGLGALLRSLVLTIGGLAVAVALPLMLLARPIMAAYGPGFSGGTPALRVVLVAYCIASFSGLFRSILAGTGRMWWQLLHSLIWGGTLTVAFGALSTEGAWGLALSYLVAYGVVVVTQGLSVRAAVGTRARHAEESART